MWQRIEETLYLSLKHCERTSLAHRLRRFFFVRGSVRFEISEVFLAVRVAVCAGNPARAFCHITQAIVRAVVKILC